MATSKEAFNEAFSILSKFERQLIPCNEFNWDYITSRVTPSKVTLWRNIGFRNEFERVKKLVKAYKGGKVVYSLESSKESEKDMLIKQLREKINDLELKLSYERERLAYAAVVARRNNIDPIMFEEESPLLIAIGRMKK